MHRTHVKEHTAHSKQHPGAFSFYYVNPTKNHLHHLCVDEAGLIYRATTSSPTVLLCSFVAQASLKLMILLPQAPKHWDSSVPPGFLAQEVPWRKELRVATLAFGREPGKFESLYKIINGWKDG